MAWCNIHGTQPGPSDGPCRKCTGLYSMQFPKRPGAVRVPWRVRGHMNAATYLHRMRLAAWAFGRNGMLPPSYTRRPGRNVHLHALVRSRHFTFAERIETARWVGGEGRWRELSAAMFAHDNADWGLTR